MGPFTVFVPTDEAFGVLPAKLVSDLRADPEKLKEVLLNHVVAGTTLSTAFTESDAVVTANGGKTLRINRYQLAPSTPKILTVNGARILKADATATNGVIHFVNRVLYPYAEQTVVDIMFGCKIFEGVANLLIETNNIDKLSGPGPFTVLAPSTESINRIKSEIDEIVANDKDKAAAIMKYHLLNGTYFSEGLFDRQYLTTEADEGLSVSCAVTTDTFFKRLAGVNDVRVTKPDIVATNGVIHLLDGVLDPGSPLITCNLL
ncbi:unnamed protein product [Notodromas monacha]|uniref:FAS1 domain-containing protein n=1 Tax=Notodromas monacha TaxID=399045 RepID=A0A7R9BIK4_9CRUS|nr:unnamed protein product [Notodromas monacha]CAG0915880.1 unnamed protein product [Notodromas monacha]